MQKLALSRVRLLNVDKSKLMIISTIVAEGFVSKG